MATFLETGNHDKLSGQFRQLVDIPEGQYYAKLKQDSVKSKQAICQFQGENEASTAAHNQQFALTKSVLAHDGILNTLLTQLSQLGSEAWIEHEATWAKVVQEQKVLGDAVHFHANQLDIAERSLEEAEVKSNALESTKQTNCDESFTLSKGSHEDVTCELVRHRRALEAHKHAKLEADAEHERRDWLLSATRCAVSVRAIQIVERARQARALVWLQHRLKIACSEDYHVKELYSMHETVPTFESMSTLELRLLSIRERLREEGGRRRQLQEMELRLCRFEIKRLLNDLDSKRERTALLEAVASARKECDDVMDCVSFESYCSYITCRLS